MKFESLCGHVQIRMCEDPRTHSAPIMDPTENRKLGVGFGVVVHPGNSPKIEVGDLVYFRLGTAAEVILDEDMRYGLVHENQLLGRAVAGSFEAPLINPTGAEIKAANERPLIEKANASAIEIISRKEHTQGIPVRRKQLVES